MSIVAEFRLVHPDIPTMRGLDRAPEMHLKAEQLIADDPQNPTVFFWAEGGDFAAFETGLEADEGIVGWERIERLADRRFYRIDVTGDRSVVIYPTDVAVGASRLGFSATVDGLDVRMRFPDREAMETYLERCREQGMEVSMRRLYGSRRQESSVPAVSEKQREALELAARRGYYRVPRALDLGELADELGVSRQAASERLRRGTESLVSEAFDVTVDGDGTRDGD